MIFHIGRCGISLIGVGDAGFPVSVAEEEGRRLKIEQTATLQNSLERSYSAWAQNCAKGNV